MASPTLLRAEVQGDEYAVKGAFLLHFGRYAEWSPPPPTRSADEFAICSWVKPYLAPYAAVLERKGLNDKRVLVRVVSTQSEASECDVLFFGADVVRQISSMEEVLLEERVLIVSDSGGRGMISFLLDDDGQVKFSLNVKQAARAGITFSSQLLKLAQHVEGGEA